MDVFTDEQREMLERILKRTLLELRDEPNLAAHKIENVLLIGMLEEQRRTNAKLEALITEIQHRGVV